MSDARDLVPELLREIRDGILAGNVRLGRLEVAVAGTNAQLAGTNERLDRVEAEVAVLGRRQVEAELRSGTAIAELQGAVRELIDETKKLHTRIDNVLTGPMGETVRDLVVRVQRLESKAS